ncbi:hypothetical protein M8J76_013579 [Diaphorina citri]|nr:hypothetical protein M8J76_013579 [Diaphorina citri]
MRLIYEGATLPKVLYGIGVWGDALSRVKVRRRLLTLQRHCGIGIAGCKFSVSHPVTQLLASEPPLDLVAQERVVIERLKKGWIQTGYFPSGWKVGLLEHIIKGPERDPAQIKSF